MCARLLNLITLSLKSVPAKTGPAGPVPPPGFCCCPVFDWQERRRKMRPRGFNNLKVWSVVVFVQTLELQTFTKWETHHLALWTKNA